MSAKTKIVVLHKNRLSLIGISALLVLFVIVLLLILFVPPSNQDKSEKISDQEEEVMRYIPGVYTSTLLLNNTPVDLQVTLDENHINSIEIVNLNEEMETMYPLVTPALNSLAEQILSTQSLENLTYSEGNQYTCAVLLKAITEAIKKSFA